MGLFGGPIENEKARDIIGDNIKVIIDTVDKYIKEETGGKSAITGKSGSDIIWSNVYNAQREIPHYIFFNGLDVPINFPYSDPYMYVACAIYYKYINTDTSNEIGKKEKKELSKAILNVKKGELKSVIYDLMRVYIDNIKTAIIRPRSADDIDRIVPKQTAIIFLADNLSVYQDMFGPLQEYDMTALYSERGQKLISDELRGRGINPSSFNNNDVYNKIMRDLNLGSLDDIYVAVGIDTFGPYSARYVVGVGLGEIIPERKGSPRTRKTK